MEKLFWEMFTRFWGVFREVLRLLEANTNYQTSSKKVKHVFKPTLEFVSKKHVRIEQGLDILICCQGNRLNTEEKPQTQLRQQ